MFEGNRLTYAELERESEALAAELQRHGVGPEVTVRRLHGAVDRAGGRVARSAESRWSVRAA
jgi:non-ribosomal peptide synthetase component F